MINKKISNEFQINGVVLLKNIIDQKWIEELRKGIEYNFQHPSEYKCVYEEVDDKEIFYDDYCNWSRISEYKNFICDSFIFVSFSISSIIFTNSSKPRNDVTLSSLPLPVLL